MLPTAPRVSPPLVLGLTLALAGGLITGCAQAPVVGVAEPAPAPRIGPYPEPRAAHVPHPLTGRTGGRLGPVLAVKIDNTRAARPQAGLRQADVVYVEQVEGGVTRLMAMFSSRLPRTVGPVRSARISDLHLLRQYGAPALAYSGVQTRMKPLMAREPFHDVSPEHAGGAYRRAADRPAPYNLFADPATLLSRAPSATPARDVGFRFGPAPAGGAPTERFTVRYPGARLDFRWSAEQRRWLVWQDGRRHNAAEGGQHGGETIVVQYARTTRSPFRDSLGNHTPLIQTTGTGRAVVLRDGKAYDATWSRPRDQDPTTFTTAGGRRMTFAPGQVWVVLADAGEPATP